MDKLTRDLIEKYLAGELDETAMAEFEHRALGEPELSAALDAAVAPTEAAFRTAFPLVEPPPTNARTTSRAPAFRLSPRWVYAALTVCAATVATALFWPRVPTVRLVTSLGVVAAGGKELHPGDVVPHGERVVCADLACFTFDGVTVWTGSPVQVFRLGQEWGTLTVTCEAGESLFTDHAQRPKYVVIAGDKRVRPLGTRLAAGLDGRGEPVCSVFEKKVMETTPGGSVILQAGQSSIGSEHKVVADDPSAVGPGADMLVPTPGGLEAARRKAEPLLPPGLGDDVRSEVVQSSASSSLAPVVRLAQDLNDHQVVDGAASLVSWSLARDPLLTPVSTAELWDLARGQSGARGDKDVALALLRLLRSRGENGPYIAAFEMVVKESSSPGKTLIAAGRSLDGFGRSEDVLVVADALVFGYESYTYDQAVLREADSRLTALVRSESGAATSETKAVAYHRLGESAFYQGHKWKSLELTKRAVFLWPRATWKVHVGTRMAECGAAPLAECLKWVAEGLVAQPSWYTYERAITALQVGATTWAQRDAEKRLVEWTAERYASVAEAQARCAELVGTAFEDYGRADELMDRAVALYGGIGQVPPHFRATFATVLSRQGKASEARHMAGMDTLDAPWESWSYLDQTGDYRQALKVLRTKPAEERDRAFVLSEAELLAKTGSTPEALAGLRAYLAAEQAYWAHGGGSESLGSYLEAATELAELTPDKREAERTAKSVLTKVCGRHEMSEEGQAYWKTLEARSLAVLGRKTEAARLVEQYLTTPMSPQARRNGETLLRRLRQ